VRSALGTDDIERIRSAKDALQQAMFKIGEQIYSQSGGTSDGGTSGAGGASSEPGDENTVDAEFKEA
jgi:molecular chaperone DnaK